MPAEHKYWFPAKRHGWGWSWPTVWQGWAVVTVFFGLLVGGAAVLLPSPGAAAFVGYSVLLCALLVAVCWFKGERPRAHWGGE
jgi:hypothetical protein